MSREKHTVLLIEDNHINRRILSRVFSIFDVNILEANDLIEATELLETYHINIAFMELYKFKLDSKQTLEKISSSTRNKGLPIIGITTSEDEVSQSRQKELGISDVILKPVQQVDIANLLKKYVFSVPLFNQQAFEEAYPSASLRKDILQAFFHEKDNDLARVQDAYKKDDSEEVYGAIHYLKGTFSYIKADKILQTAQKILDLIKEDKYNESKQYHQQFLDEFLDLHEILQKYV